jgi:hypothetical protein
MKISYLALSLSLVLPLVGEAQEQVYKTTDAQGNTEFTDFPPTEEAQRVELGSTNIADSVEARPHETAAAPRENPGPAAAKSPQETPVYIGDDDDLNEDVYEERRKRELRDRATDGVNTPAHLPANKPAARPAVRPAAGGRR